MPPGDVVFYHVLQHSCATEKMYTNPGDYLYRSVGHCVLNPDDTYTVYHTVMINIY